MNASALAGVYFLVALGLSGLAWLCVRLADTGKFDREQWAKRERELWQGIRNNPMARENARKS